MPPAAPTAACGARHSIFSARILALVMETNQARRYFVSGIVQGVGYRFFARDAAAEAGVCGYVCNLADGRVEAFAMGTPRQLARFRQELERGPAGASVSQVDEHDAAPDPDYAHDFSILLSRSRF